MPADRISLRLDPETKAALDALARAQGITPSAAVRTAILLAHRLAPFQAQVLADLDAIKTALARLAEPLAAVRTPPEDQASPPAPVRGLVLEMPPETPAAGQP